jgi:hypothetical protein
MDWSGPWWLLVLGFGLALLIGAAVYASRSRRSGFRSAAAQVGFSEFNGPTPFGPDERKGLNLFSRGYGGKFANMFADNLETPSALFFDFTYRFGLRLIASVGYKQTVAAFSARTTSLPDFKLMPATSLDRLAPMLGLQAIRFESRPEFGKRYWLRASDEIPVRALFNDTFLDRLSIADPKATWYVEKNGRWLPVYHHGKSVTPPALPQFFQAAKAMAELFSTPS